MLTTIIIFISDRIIAAIIITITIFTIIIIIILVGTNPFFKFNSRFKG